VALTKIGKEGVTGISNSSDATAITIDSSENLGIGTASPTNGKLEVTLSSSTVPAGHFRNTSASGDSPSLTVQGGANNAAANFSVLDYDGNTDFVVQGAGNVGIGTTPGNKLHVQGTTNVVKFEATSLSDRVLTINQNADGDIIVFDVSNSAQGKISVSGSTVSYNGGHLARWSQATDGNRITGLVKGTVMTNLDQMAKWTKDGVTEDNEQLNCMAVSSVEGDVNVAGVFVNWDYDDDGFNDMNVAMTGDMVICIAKGTTVERGDLLMSAGDGTAKPQGDDIVRSKTIAKVTSKTVSHTYDDGTYLVPCVLMAC
jgi:hypothetical protein